MNEERKRRKKLRRWFRSNGYPVPYGDCADFYASVGLLEFYKDKYKKEKAMCSTGSFGCAGSTGSQTVKIPYQASDGSYSCKIVDATNYPITISPFDCSYYGTIGDVLSNALQCNQEEKVNSMYATKTNVAAATIYADAPFSQEQTAQKYLLTRLDAVKARKRSALRETFNIDYSGPTTLREMIADIKADKFKADPDGGRTMDFILDEKDCFDHYSNPFRRLVWTGKKRDTDGFAKAIEAMDAAYTTAKDTIMVGPAEDGLKAVQTFDAATFS